MQRKFLSLFFNPIISGLGILPTKTPTQLWSIFRCTYSLKLKLGRSGIRIFVAFEWLTNRHDFGKVNGLCTALHYSYCFLSLEKTWKMEITIHYSQRIFLFNYSLFFFRPSAGFFIYPASDTRSNFHLVTFSRYFQTRKSARRPFFIKSWRTTKNLYTKRRFSVYGKK